MNEIELQLNGNAHRVPAGCNLQDLLHNLGLAGQALALAVNRQVVPRQRWTAQALQAGDQVEIVKAIGGG